MATATATFAAGCFWGVEATFREVDGVVETRVGYCGGRIEHPSYWLVSTGLTGHAEAVEVTYDLAHVSYQELLAVFWSIHDPTQKHRQGADIGPQYRSVIFHHTDEQRKLAEASKAEQQEQYEKPVQTEIVPRRDFFLAEEHHQQYYEKQQEKTC